MSGRYSIYQKALQKMGMHVGKQRASTGQTSFAPNPADKF